MAVITIGRGLIRSATGPLGGQILFTSKAGIFSTRVPYVDEQETPLQKKSRQNFLAVDAYFMGMSQTERDQWYKRKPHHSLSNYSYFMAYNVPRWNAGMPIALVPPDEVPNLGKFPRTRKGCRHGGV